MRCKKLNYLFLFVKYLVKSGENLAFALEKVS